MGGQGISPSTAAAWTGRIALPPLDEAEVLASSRRRIAALDLNLSGSSFAAEAATGAYASTAVIAALAGAREVDGDPAAIERHVRPREKVGEEATGSASR